MYQAYAIRPVGSRILFNPGGGFDQNFALSSVAARQFIADFYPTVAGPFQVNYLHRNLADWGLVDCSYGPKLAHFPFADDAGAIVDALREFAASFVDSYYARHSFLSQYNELQAWISEASSDAKVIDFPVSPLSDKKTLIDILTHLAYLTGVNQHTLNGETLSMSSGVLSLGPLSAYPSGERCGIRVAIPP